MISFDDFIADYTHLERNIQQLMIRLVGETCGSCTACCCRTDICEETLSSAFLSRLLKQQGRSPDALDDRYGWLDLHGCGLEYGRPPVCYAYFCDELLARCPDAETEKVLTTFGLLLHHVGLQAEGDLHLTELRTPEQLQHIDVERLTQRLQQAEAALEVIEHFMQSNRLSRQDRATLAAITTEAP